MLFNVKHENERSVVPVATSIGMKDIATYQFYKKINYSTKTVIFIHNHNFFTEDFTKFILTLYCLVFEQLRCKLLGHFAMLKGLCFLPIQEMSLDQTSKHHKC